MHEINNITNFNSSKVSDTENSLDVKQHNEQYKDLKLEGEFNGESDNATVKDGEENRVTIKEIKNKLDLKDADIASMFGYKDAVTFRNSTRKKHVLNGITQLFSKMKDLSRVEIVNEVPKSKTKLYLQSLEVSIMLLKLVLNRPVRVIIDIDGRGLTHFDIHNTDDTSEDSKQIKNVFREYYNQSES